LLGILFQEESPGCIEAEFRLTDGWGNPRESATESRLPDANQVKVKRWGKSPPESKVI